MLTEACKQHTCCLTAAKIVNCTCRNACRQSLSAHRTLPANCHPTQALTRAKDRLYITSVRSILGSCAGKRAAVRECEYQLPQEPGLVQRQEFPKPRKGMAAGASQQVEEAAAAAEQAVMMLERPVAAVVA